METGPLPAPIGTLTTRVVADALVTFALTPLNFMIFSFKTVLKLLPFILTSVSGFPNIGLIDVMEGGLACFASGVSFLQEEIKAMVNNNSKNKFFIMITYMLQYIKFIGKPLQSECCILTTV